MYFSQLSIPITLVSLYLGEGMVELPEETEATVSCLVPPHTVKVLLRYIKHTQHSPIDI